MSNEPSEFVDSVFRTAGLEEPRLKPGEDFTTFSSRPNNTDGPAMPYRAPTYPPGLPLHPNTRPQYAQAVYTIPPNPSPAHPSHGGPTQLLHGLPRHTPAHPYQGPGIPDPTRITVAQYGAPTSSVPTRPIYARNDVAKTLFMLNNPSVARTKQSNQTGRQEALPPRFRNHTPTSSASSQAR